MSEGRATTSPGTATARVETRGDATLVDVSGTVDEAFAGFGALPETSNIVIDVTRLTRITPPGLKRWAAAMAALAGSHQRVYLLGCPPFFVHQMNMVLSFAQPARVLTVQARFLCAGCGGEPLMRSVDVLADREALAEGVLRPEACPRCRGPLALEEPPKTYFAFLKTYAPSSLSRDAGDLLEAKGLYRRPDRKVADSAQEIGKLVHGSVNYFTLKGTIGQRFRARPMLVGVEGEVVLDLARIERFDAEGAREWDRLIEGLAGHASAITLVDVGAPIVSAAALGHFRPSPHLRLHSLAVLYLCRACQRVSVESVVVKPNRPWPPRLDARVCPTCGGTTVTELEAASLAPLASLVGEIPPESQGVIAMRAELTSRAQVEDTVAQSASAPGKKNDMVLGKYLLLHHLASGGMADVFLAKQVGIDKPVALKRIHRAVLEEHFAVDMFLNEAKIAARLVHPNVVQVYDVGEERGALFLAMEYVHGKDLRVVMKALRDRGKRMPLAHVLHVMHEVAIALHHAYWSIDLEGKQLQVVHRDVSPHNVLVRFDGAVKLSDFGLAMSTVTTDQEPVVTGKWTYMSPEQTEARDLDHRSDLFALGIILYQLSTGMHPFGVGEPAQIVDRIRAGRFPPAHTLNPEVPRALEDLMALLLRVDRDERPRHGSAVAGSLRDIARAQGLEASASQLAIWLAETFPNELTSPVAPGKFGLTLQSGSPAPISTRSHTLRPPTSSPPAPAAPEPVPLPADTGDGRRLGRTILAALVFGTILAVGCCAALRALHL